MCAVPGPMGGGRFVSRLSCPGSGAAEVLSLEVEIIGRDGAVLR